MASKRSRSSPTGLTPHQRKKHQNRQECIESASAKKLSKLSFATNASWSAVEGCALVKYVMDKEFVASWPQTKRREFWESAAKYFQLQEGCTSGKRTSKITANLCLENLLPPWLSVIIAKNYLWRWHKNLTSVCTIMQNLARFLTDSW